MNPSRSVLRLLVRSAASPSTWAPQRQLRPLSRRSYQTTTRRRPQIPASSQRSLLSQVRYESTATLPEVQTPAASPEKGPESRLERDQVPSYEMTFTCKKCDTRSSHRVSKQGYYHGTVLITCPGCKNRHLIADHLKIFSDEAVTIEDIMREKGQLVKRGSLTTDGDVEMWPEQEAPKSDSGTLTKAK